MVYFRLVFTILEITCARTQSLLGRYLCSWLLWRLWARGNPCYIGRFSWFLRNSSVAPRYQLSRPGSMTSHYFLHLLVLPDRRFHSLKSWNDFVLNQTRCSPGPHLISHHYFVFMSHCYWLAPRSSYVFHEPPSRSALKSCVPAIPDSWFHSSIFKYYYIYK